MITNNYRKRINNVLQYIEDNLTHDLSLEQIATVAYYSPYHFHRIFKAVIGESLHNYITRKRIEKASGLLLHNEGLSISEITSVTGFNSNSSFTRAFNKFYGLSPTQFRKSSTTKFSKIRKVKSKNGKSELLIEPYICNIMNHLNFITMNANIEVKELSKIQLAYVTQIGMQNIGFAFEKLIKWAGPKGIINSPDLKAVTIYHDSPKITSPDKVRISAGFTIDESVQTSGEISRKDLYPGKCIVASMTIGINEFQKSWEGMFVWMNENGYQYDSERDPFEIHHNNFNDHPEKKCILDMCIPVK